MPRETTEAAIADGCTHWSAFYKVVLPQMKGAIAATALFVFILNWSDLLIALFMTNDSTQTAPVFLAQLENDELQRQFGHQSALAVILATPPVVLGMFAQRYLVRGLTFGAIRGGARRGASSSDARIRGSLPVSERAAATDRP